MIGAIDVRFTPESGHSLPAFPVSAAGQTLPSSRCIVHYRLLQVVSGVGAIETARAPACN